MEPDSIIEPFDIIENISTGTRAGIVLLVMNPFVFQSTEKTFDHSVIITISLSTHTYLDAVGSQDITDLVTCILATPVRMMKQTKVRLTLV